MSPVVFYTIISLSTVGIVAAVILYFVAQRFKVVEDPRIDQIEQALPGANCGGCGFPGCRAFAEACVKADDLSQLFCPVGGSDCMGVIAKILNLQVQAKEKLVAVVRCEGSYDKRPKTIRYDGAPTCAIMHQAVSSDTGCPNGCLSWGDCVVVCRFDAIHMNPVTGLPEVDEKKCTACGACVTACPKGIIELRKMGPKGCRIYVGCVNQDPGSVARKACQAACIGCGLCVKACPFDAISLEKNLAYIDQDKCKLCRKCVAVCPTGAIVEINFPPKKQPQTDATRHTTHGEGETTQPKRHTIQKKT